MAFKEAYRKWDISFFMSDPDPQHGSLYRLLTKSRQLVKVSLRLWKLVMKVGDICVGGERWGIVRARDGKSLQLPLELIASSRSVGVLREAKSGTRWWEICCNNSINRQRLYLWKKKYAGLGLKEQGELRELCDENAKQKRLVADLSLDRHILQEIVATNL